MPDRLAGTTEVALPWASAQSAKSA